VLPTRAAHLAKRPLPAIPFGRPIASEGWLIPSSVMIADGHIKASYPLAHEVKRGPPLTDPDGARAQTGRALRAFAEIATVKESDFGATLRDFVATFGQLGLDASWSPRTIESRPIYPAEAPEGLWVEDCAAYRFFAELAVSTIALAQCARRSIGPHPDYLHCVAGFLGVLSEARETWERHGAALDVPDLSGSAWYPGLAEAEILEGQPLNRWYRDLCAHAAAGVVNWWSTELDSKPVISWRGAELVRVWAGGLWGVLAAHLADAVLHSVKPMCFGCGKELLSKREATRRGVMPNDPRVVDRPGHAKYCRAPECQREHTRVRVALHRAAVNP
jgi:hypothetical protein